MVFYKPSFVAGIVMAYFSLLVNVNKNLPSPYGFLYSCASFGITYFTSILAFVERRLESNFIFNYFIISLV